MLKNTEFWVLEILKNVLLITECPIRVKLSAFPVQFPKRSNYASNFLQNATIILNIMLKSIPTYFSHPLVILVSFHVNSFISLGADRYWLPKYNV